MCMYVCMYVYVCHLRVVGLLGIDRGDRVCCIVDTCIA